MKHSSGILMYRFRNGGVEFFLVHSGGPYWGKKDEGFWSIPKGEIEEGEKTDDAVFRRALIEVEEETGIILSKEKKLYEYLGEIQQRNNKKVKCWAIEHDWNGLFRQNIIEIEYPMKSGKFIKIPEVDRAEYFTESIARKKINEAQLQLIDRLKEKLGI
ncbi:MAG: hypothetical protein RL557_943 [archaeon]|jgi:predicted NUDIX family NTP pyrophosphohydrolase